MKTSARNQLHGRVVAIRKGSINDEIELQLDGGSHIVAVITQSSTQALGLAEGKSAVALIKAPWIILATDMDDMILSTRNRLEGVVEAIQPGAVNAEVALRLKGGELLVAIVTSSSLHELGLHIGGPVTALFKASHVILGVPRNC